MNNISMLAFFAALSIVIVVGLVAIPVIEEADARSQTAEERNKGQQGDDSSGGKRQSGGGCGRACG